MSNFKTITAIFNDKESARKALIYLRSQGVKPIDMSVLGSEDSIDKDMDMEFESEQTIAEKGAMGASVGAAVGASALGLTVFTASTLTGGAALLGAGPMISALAGATAGATAGGLIGGFIGIGVPEVEAREIEKKLEEGHVVVGIQAKPEEAERAKKLMDSADGERVVVH